MQKVDVFFRGWGQSWLVGTLAQTGAQVLFEYSDEALRRGVKFSELQVPLRRETFSNFPHYFGGLPGFVADALPDGWGLLLMDRIFTKAGRNPSSLTHLDRLSFVGERAMGALAFLPSADMHLDPEELTLVQLAEASQIILEAGETTALMALALIGGSPHGARPKALVHIDAAEQVSTLPNALGAPWLVKFPAQGEHAEVCAIEYAYAEAARLCGIDIPATRHFDLGKNLAAFAVERFDRRGQIRVPIQTFAAALHANFRVPQLDYQTVLRATRFMTGSEKEVLKAFERAVFNVVFNNRDDHAKNFSFRMTERFEWELSPAYDLTFNSGPGGYHQTAVLGEAKAPGREHLLKLAKQDNLDPSVAVRIIDRIRDLAPLFEALLDASAVRKVTKDHIKKAVGQNVRRCGATAQKSRPPRAC